MVTPVSAESSTMLDLGDLAAALPPPPEDDISDIIEGIPCEVTDPAILAAIERNLGYIPTNLIRVAAMYETRETHEMEPGVLLLYPLRNCMDDYKKHHRKMAEPFPTIYWLASHELSERISVLEAAGLVTQFTDRLAASATHVQTMTRMHADYSTERMALLTPADRALVVRKRWIRALEAVGIAGIRNPASVKCLHTQYAHYLATKNNLVGEWIHAALYPDEEADKARTCGGGGADEDSRSV
ncbi:Aste57867_14186 [Aphanomyces stellatus]|uniref:Aste57867_14186 protein n=1 Tax=Aphanomyces stellatus TaxID=120398 RepID=A0A485L0L8_9STRA|nr:hypothetical protein As57867_014135 [Aphanomyces stellatus]VFT91011.1 Aste57867_14186 [Aphanomyces stellatus]